MPMDLRLDPALAAGYASSSQIARLVTEAWAVENLYCLACPSENLTQELPNSPVRDFTCSSCSATYQLKSKNGRHGRTVSNSAYDKKIAAVDDGRVPHYAFLDYSRARWKVTGLFVVPGHLIGRGVIAKRRPLGPQAKRAGWVGSTLLLSEIPAEGRIPLVTDGEAIDPASVREKWEMVAFLASDPRGFQGWGADVFSRVNLLISERGKKEFTLREFNCRFIDELSTLHPENRNVSAKIRQQMQVLRDGGILEFVDNRGLYRFML